MGKSSLIPISQKRVEFYGDQLTVAAVQDEGKEQFYVPVRPICESLGVDFSGQRQRINRDPVLAKYARFVVVTPTNAAEAAKGGNPNLLCLPLDYISGFLFGINAARVKPELRERLLIYQERCYRVLSEALQEGRLTANPDFDALLEKDTEAVQAYQMALAIVKLARNQVLMESRINQHEERIELLESQLGDPGRYVTPDQASQISQAVKTVALALGKKSGRNEFGAVYGELYRKFGITGYKMLPARRFDEAMKFLTDWHEDLAGTLPF
jgi:hypothetical protein